MIVRLIYGDGSFPAFGTENHLFLLFVDVLIKKQHNVKTVKRKTRGPTSVATASAGNRGLMTLYLCIVTMMTQRNISTTDAVGLNMNTMRLNDFST